MGVAVRSLAASTIFATQLASSGVSGYTLGKIFAKRKGEPALKKLKDAAKKQENKKSAADPKAPASAKPSMMMEKKAKTTTAAKSAAGLMAKSKLVSTKKASMGVDCTMKGPDAGVEVTDTADVQWICTEMTKTETGTTNELPFRGLLNYKKNLATPRNAIKLHTLADGEEAGNASTPVVNYRFVECKEPDIDIMSCTVGQICDACQKATDKCPDTPTTEEQMGPDASGEGGLLKCT
ncbi:unnamed protein product [Amoebophrya sp. A120]|nr:unnamed protein product [Amoebophrya sp. A120]|eukprot:GSA120T00022629001.1